MPDLREHLLCADCGHNEQIGAEGDPCESCGSIETVGTGPVGLSVREDGKGSEEEE